MKTIQISLFIFLSLLFANCSSNDQEKKETNPKSFAKEATFEQRMLAIDSNQQLIPIYGLSFSNEEGCSVRATGYVDEKGAEQKIEEEFNDDKAGISGLNTFYIENGKKIASKELLFFTKGKKIGALERVSYYDKNAKVIYTKERSAKYEDELINLPFQTSKPYDCSIDRAMRALNDDGEFETTFQGIIESNGLQFIVVGPNTPTGYTSALAVQMEIGDVVKLLTDGRKYIGVPLEVTFEPYTDERGMEYQVLLTLKFK